MRQAPSSHLAYHREAQLPEPAANDLHRRIRMVSRNGVLGARYEAAIQRPGKALHRGGDFTQNDFRRIDSHRYSRLHRHSVGRPDEEASQGVGGGTRQWILQPAKSATAAEIAQRLGIPRTSFVDHLRKAQNKVIRGVGPYLRLKAAEP